MFTQTRIKSAKSCIVPSESFHSWQCWMKQDDRGGIGSGIALTCFFCRDGKIMSVACLLMHSMLRTPPPCTGTNSVGNFLGSMQVLGTRVQSSPITASPSMRILAIHTSLKARADQVVGGNWVGPAAASKGLIGPHQCRFARMEKEKRGGEATESLARVGCNTVYAVRSTAGYGVWTIEDRDTTSFVGRLWEGRWVTVGAGEGWGTRGERSMA